MNLQAQPARGNSMFSGFPLILIFLCHVRHFRILAGILVNNVEGTRASQVLRRQKKMLEVMKSWKLDNISLYGDVINRGGKIYGVGHIWSFD